MRSFWKSNFGKLVIGGCGIQTGTVFTCGGIAVVLLFCIACAFVNTLSIGLTQELARVPTPPPIEVSSSSQEVDLLQEKIDVLAGQVSSLQASPPVVPAPTPVPAPPPKPFVLATQSGVNLRSGPGAHYTRLSRLPLGQSLEIVGRNSDSTWWLVTTPDGFFAWVSNMVVAVHNINDSIPVVTIPALLVQPASSSPAVIPPTTMLPETGNTLQETGNALSETGNTSNLPMPVGTPTAVASQNRRFVQDTRGYKQLARRLLLPTVSESFSPHGDQIAITEKIKLYTINTDGSNIRILFEDSEIINLIGGAVWSPNGEYIAFVADYIQNCDPCRTVGLVRLSDGSVTFLESPAASLGLDIPRWTQDGRLLVNAHPGDPAHGAIYIYNTSGSGEVATGTHLLSSSHDGQKWLPWQPGKTWQVDSTQPTSYYQ